MIKIINGRNAPKTKKTALTGFSSNGATMEKIIPIKKKNKTLAIIKEPKQQLEFFELTSTILISWPRLAKGYPI